jgi:hypothetical protein
MRVRGPSIMETTMVKTETSLVTHVLGFSAERRSEKLDVVEDAFPLVKVPMEIKMEKAPSKVTLEPQGETLDFVYEQGCVKLEGPYLMGTV